MRSKWYRSVVAVALVAVFAVGTMAASGGYEEFRIGAVSGDPLRGMTTATLDPQAHIMALRAVVAVGLAIWPFRPHLDPGGSGSMPTGMLDESIFD